MFDFKRIEVADIVGHLRHVADSEGVKYEEGALELIARKAEGGMRDALSTFDQLVNFTGANLTRQGCLENLNLLDEEYYFRLVDFMRSGNISGALLLYREVIAKGFGGQHFLTGLCEHLRNLMVSLDPQTLQLIEGGDALRQRNGQQAQQCGLPMLLGWLGTASDYEFRFREANNKNLFVEVCLMRLASVTLPQT